jgi:TATA-binding protein-associated factor
MRREKSDVLKDLPDKIIQDFYCEMGETQAALYGQFQKDFKPEEDAELTQTEEGLTKKSFFTVLSQLRKVLNHPSLLDDKSGKPEKKKKRPPKLKKADQKDALTEDLTGVGLGKRRDIDQSAVELASETSPVGFYEQSGKFVGLRELLRSLDFSEEDVLACSGNQNKMLIFTRSNDTLDLLQLFLREIFPFLKFLTLHKAQTQFQRAEVVDQFNRERDCKALLLTPKIGGLGLNLHSANVVVMFDHDFNPMNDLQAMDRAHRLGQKNVVNVYRMITLGTIEEQILGIQRFKLSVARTVINAENTSIRNVKDSNFLGLIDSFAQQNIRPEEKEEEALSKTFGPYGRYLKDLEMDEVWDEDEYQKEYLE